MERKLITQQEKELAGKCMEFALGCGASAVRITLSKSMQSSVAVLDGEVDKTLWSLESSMLFHIFADGRYGVFSTNRLEIKALEEFIRTAVDTVRLLAPDPFRRLPDRSRTASGCNDGDEMDLVHPSGLSEAAKVEMALAASRPCAVEGFATDSVETELSDSFDDTYIIDSEGFEGNQSETSHGFSASVTLEDSEGNRYSSYQWMNATDIRNLDAAAVTALAMKEAAAQAGPKDIPSGRYNIVVDRRCAARLVSPIFSALDASSIQQGNSFLRDSIGKLTFSRDLTIEDRPLEKGRAGSRIFDSEGVRTENRAIIDGGTVTCCFADTYMAGKMGIEPTLEMVSRPCIRPFICNCDKKEIYLGDILRSVGECLYITDFNGGNCNGASGNFSFGAEGFLVRDGKPVHPVRGIVLTGNMISLWNSLTAVGSDPRPFTRWQIPTLAFKDVDTSA